MFSGLNILYPKPSITGSTYVAAQSLTVSTAAVAATGYTAASSGSSPVQLVTFDIQANTVRTRWDGTDPTSTVGTILAAGSNYTWSLAQYNAAKFIRISTATGDAVIFAHPMTS